MKNEPTDIHSLDSQYIWHPFTQMKTSLPHLPVVKAKDALLFTENGETIIDAISSWWVNIHGHCHPRLQQSISSQVQELDHVIFAGFTHKPAAHFARKILEAIGTNQKKIFYSDNGSTAVEVAIKMAVQYWHNKGVVKNKIIALKGGYHGDTFGAMSVGERGPFTSAFENMMFEVEYINIHQSKEKVREELLEIISLSKNKIAAFIFEPLVQGAGGMLMYHADTLSELIKIAKQHHIITVADEVMTGFGRTGKLFASHYLTQKPDIFCLSKGITGGILPLGATTCSAKIYNAFLSEDKVKTFFHGHSYTANPISLAAAITSLEMLLDRQKDLDRIHQKHCAFKEKLVEYGNIENVRLCGTILAFDIKSSKQTSYFNDLRNTLYQKFLDQGVLLRPLGNVVYIMPPYCIKNSELDRVYTAIEKTLQFIKSPEDKIK